MTVTLEIPSDLQSKLAREAAQRGVTLTEHLLGLLAGRELANSPVRTGADLVAYWRREGLMATRSAACDAPAHARSLREQAERRERP